VGLNEDVVANGTRTKDERHDGQRVVRYEMNDPLPTYTMAFAAGEIEHRDRTTGRIPISVWYRRGLMLDPNDMLGLLSDAMTSFENLVGPYPWPAYAVVLLPEFSGGMENTTITFTTETSGQANPGTNLQAHELAHQWFGDWVTVATFDDVWIKEGMATLLAPEADRAQRDADGKGRRFGSYFAFSPNDAIRDRALVGLAKYTSGPYQRAAWLLTQIRERVGDVAFWQSLRQVLAKYALGSIDSESFVRSFGLDDPTVQKILRLLDEKRVPAVAITTTLPRSFIPSYFRKTSSVGWSAMPIRSRRRSVPKPGPNFNRLRNPGTHWEPPREPSSWPAGSAARLSVAMCAIDAPFAKN
jgi:hypothetical protein